METPLAIGGHIIYLCGVSGGYNGVTTPFWGLGVGSVPGLCTPWGVKRFWQIFERFYKD